MDISPPTAFALLQQFGRLEFTLKSVPQFIDGRLGKRAQVHWGNVETTLKTVPASDFVEAISVLTLEKVLRGDRNRPRVQVVGEDHGTRLVMFDLLDLPREDAIALLRAAKRVRNNLFHGGKENPLDQPFDGDDQQWVDAAVEIVDRLNSLNWKRLAMRTFGHQ